MSYEWRDRKKRLTLVKALKRSDYMTAFVSPRYIDSGWCLLEWSTMESIEKERRSEQSNTVNDILSIWWKPVNDPPEGIRDRHGIDAVDDAGIYACYPDCRHIEAIEHCVEETIRYLDGRKFRHLSPFR
jgi:hypothetical protein